MMGPRQVEQGALFYNFSLVAHVPADHLLRSIDRFVDLSDLRRELAPFYSSTGRPSVDPELMIRMLIIGYCLGIRSERRLCEEVHLSMVLPVGARRTGARSFDVLEEPAWSLSRERCSPALVREDPEPLHRGRLRRR